MRRVLITGASVVGLCSILIFGLFVTNLLRTPSEIIETDILVYGTGLGGSSAAIAAAEQGARVVLATESTTIGGQAVESGVSAFDDLRKPWEQWGLYLDLQKFLQQKRGFTDDKHAGLGDAVVGRVASIPSDIEEFFRSRISQQKNLTLLTEHTLLTVRKQWWLWGKWKEADLLNLRTKEKLRVRFTYLVDGTTTGHVLDRTGTPFRLGFDTQEETGERYALTKDQRWAFMNGMEQDGKHLEGFGNRIQAATSTFALLDRGYPGEFLPVTTPSTYCSPPATASGFIVGSKLYAVGNPACAARISVLPEFSDVYDIYLVHHGGGTVSNVILSHYWPDDPISLSVELPPDDTFTFLGSFPAGPNDGMTIIVTSLAQRIFVEGVLLVKRNLAPADPLVFRAPLQEKLQLNMLDPSPVLADIYVTGSIPSTENIIFDGQTFILETVGPQTLRLSDVPLRQENDLQLPLSLRNDGNSIIIIPTAPNIARLAFQGSTPSRELSVANLESSSTLSKTTLPIREWDFIAPLDGEALFQIESDSSAWKLLELWSDDPAKRMTTLSFVANNVTRNPRPLFSATLIKGNRYRLRMAVTANGSWNAFTWSIAFPQNSALIRANDDTGLTLPPHAYRGIYDIWTTAPGASQILCTLQRPNSADRIWPVAISHPQYEYAGKVFLDQTTTLVTSKEVTSLLAIPNPHVDGYLYEPPSVASSAPLNLSSLPPGHYQAILTGKDPSPVTITALLQGMPSPQSLAFPSQTPAESPRLSSDMLSNDGRLLSLTLPQGVSTLRLFEDIPNLQDTWTYAMSNHPLIGDPDQEPVPLFSFRNIISPLNLLKGNGGVPPTTLGRNTAGVTLVINPSNDFAGIKAEDIDSQDFVESSRARSESYAYWMKYDAALTKKNLGCDPAELLCTTKRIRLMFGIFADPLSPFPPKPYVRESRRLVSARVVRYEDLAPAFSACTDSSCPQDCSQLPGFPQLCITEAQEPLLFSDALAAAGYAIDIHSFYSTQETYSGVLELLAAMRQKFGGEEPLLLHPVWNMIYARPAEVSLSALLARDGGNVFPSANNMGLTQIANGLYRTHVNEMAIGQAVGSLLSAALTQGIPPSEFKDAHLRPLQHSLVERGFVLYPIEDMMTDAPLRTGVQHLVIEKLLTPAAVLPERPANPWGTVAYRISPSSPTDDRDLPIVQALFPTSAPNPLTYRLLLGRLSDVPSPTDDLIRQNGLSQGMIDKKHQELPTDKLLASPPSKGDLYRAAALILHNRWSAAEQKK